MQETLKLLNLQLFADGNGTGTGAGSAGEGEGNAVPGVASEAEAAAQRLRELGVPEDRIRRRAKQKSAKAEEPSIVIQRGTDGTEAQQTESPAAEENKQEAPAKMSWADIRKDPYYKKDFDNDVSGIVQKRVKDFNALQEKLDKITSAMSGISGYYGVAADDIDGIVDKLTSDNHFYEDEADKLGVTADVARRLRQAEVAEEQQKKQAAALAAKQAEEEKNQAIRSHFESLVKQGEKLKQTVTGFDLQTELSNPTFARLTAPGSGLTLEDAYYAVHRQDMMQAGMTQATINAQRQIANAVQANASRPVENGIGSQASSLTQMDYRNMSKQQRQQLRDQIHRAAGRGEKLYPSDIFRR